MKNLKRQSFWILCCCLLCATICFSQNTSNTVKMPSQQNKIIIDKIIEAANYKNYVVDFCLTTINEASQKEKWNEQKALKITESINFKNFRDAVYNMFAYYNELELEAILKNYEQDKAYQIANVMVVNDALGYNLEIFANDIVRGKYIAK
ncbi:hypothetical protein E0W73_18575 [Flavobacterium foetidum]|nr:hypothetical protein E0W73_18575 [Flavobacterium foetidum]